MTADELKARIRAIAPTVVKSKKKSDEAAVEYDELTKFPELKKVIVDLLTDDFDNFLASIDWVAPKPTTFRINLKNDQEFYLIYSKNSWIAQIEGKKYYLLNLPEEERATKAIARILRYGPKPEPGEGLEDELGLDMGAETPVEAPIEPEAGEDELPPLEL